MAEERWGGRNESQTGKRSPGLQEEPLARGNGELVFQKSGGTAPGVQCSFSPEEGVDSSVLYRQREGLRAGRHGLHMGATLRENQLRSVAWSYSLRTAKTQLTGYFLVHSAVKWLIIKLKLQKRKREWLTLPLKGGKSVEPCSYSLPGLGGQLLHGCPLAARRSWVRMLAGSLRKANSGTASLCLIKSQQPFPLALRYIKNCRVRLYV